MRYAFFFLVMLIYVHIYKLGEKMREQLLYYAYKYYGDYKKIKKAIEKQEKWEKIEYKGNYLTILDFNYPTVLKKLLFPPWVLFYEGDITLLEKEMIGIVGSREMSFYGKKCTQLLVENMHSKYGVISGLAKGIDSYAHLMAMHTSRFTVGVLGCGIDVIYPKENEYLYHKMKKEHLIISEYPNGTKPYAYHFPWRNRIIAALCKKLVVVEAKMKSGTMITVNEALELGIPIYAFTHAIDSVNGEGCNYLIKEGSEILGCIEDIKDL